MVVEDRGYIVECFFDHCVIGQVYSIKSIRTHRYQGEKRTVGDEWIKKHRYTLPGAVRSHKDFALNPLAVGRYRLPRYEQKVQVGGVNVVFQVAREVALVGLDLIGANWTIFGARSKLCKAMLWF